MPGHTSPARSTSWTGPRVHVRGRLQGSVATECGRCLEDYELSVGQELDLFYLPRAQGRPQEQAEEVELSDRDVVVGYYDGERLDLGEVLREQIVLGLPLRRLCPRGLPRALRELWPGPQPGDLRLPATEEIGDSRLAPLRKLFQKN